MALWARFSRAFGFGCTSQPREKRSKEKKLDAGRPRAQSVSELSFQALKGESSRGPSQEPCRNSLGQKLFGAPAEDKASFFSLSYGKPCGIPSLSQTPPMMPLPALPRRLAKGLARLGRFLCSRGLLSSAASGLLLFPQLGEGKGLPPLRVGMELTHPPFEMTDSQGRPAGISVDLAGELAAFLGRELQIRSMRFEGLLPALATGELDLIISSLTVTPERSRVVLFSRPYFRVGLAILTRAQSPIHSVHDLAQPGLRIAVKLGTTGHIFALQNCPQARLVVLPDETTAALEVAQGKADAFLYDQISIYYLSQKFQKETRALLEPFQAEAWAIAVSKRDPALLDEVNRFLGGWLSQGGMRRLLVRYLPADPGTPESVRKLLGSAPP
jgi:polar amino acid transport system substrate-binding protein